MKVKKPPMPAPATSQARAARWRAISRARRGRTTGAPAKRTYAPCTSRPDVLQAEHSVAKDDEERNDRRDGRRAIASSVHQQTPYGPSWLTCRTPHDGSCEK